MQYYLEVLKKYAVFSGRARRAEYWWFALFNLIALIVLYLAGVLTFGVNSEYSELFSGIYSLLVLLPSLGVTVRRLHDTNRSGWWYFIVFVPLIGGIVLLIFTLLDSDVGENRYGPSPKTYDYSAATPA